jgi:murein L,D-transpeptidase YafK
VAALLCGWLCWVPAPDSLAQSFEARQREYPRVDAAFEAQYDALAAQFEERGLPFPPHAIFLRVIKRDRALEVWAQPASEAPFEWVRNIDVCYYSGTLGPKRREGDRQHPEGFYTIDRFNPRSRYHLSLRISYPNRSDRILGDPDTPGGDIFIHGGCGSTGCLAVTDAGIEPLYVLAVLARSGGQRHIPIHIFPIRFSDEDDLAWLREVTDDPGLWEFWTSLRPGFDYFEQHRRLPRVEIDQAGRYLVSAP